MSGNNSGGTGECKWYPLCPMKRFFEKGLLDEKWINGFCKGGRKCVRYAMEERMEAHPDWMLPDGSLDERLRRYC